MRRASFEDMSCSIARSLEVIGEWWTLLILRDAFFGVTRFEELHERLGIARNILAKRLDTLVDHGVLERRCYDEARARHDYVLTEKGKALWPVLVTLRQWGDEWVVGEGKQPVAMVHTSCGEQTTAFLTCDHCGEELQRRDVRVVAGPGLDDPAMLPAVSRSLTVRRPRQSSSAAGLVRRMSSASSLTVATTSAAGRMARTNRADCP